MDDPLTVHERGDATAQAQLPGTENIHNRDGLDANADTPLIGSAVRTAGRKRYREVFSCVSQHLVTYSKFIGPGFLIAVAYIDPGNYATDVAAGSETRFALLFIIFASNLIAILFQSLCIKLGIVTGRDLAQNCRAHLPRWMTLLLYGAAETAIIATDISEVIGSAISLKLLFNIPLVAGCAITLVDTLFILMFYRPYGSMMELRAFEGFVTLLVLGVTACFCVELSFIRDTSVGEVLRGYLPSATIFRGNAIYLSCGIVGATVMPHSLFLGSGLVQARLKEFDLDQGYAEIEGHGNRATAGNSHTDENRDGDKTEYHPTIAAIRGCMKYSIVELSVSLVTFATFVNSAILIVSGASLYGNPEAGDADLFGIHDLLSQTISPAAGTVFALALLFSGLSAGVIGTIAGQMVSEGMLDWKMSPWVRRLITRSISIVPSVVIAAAVGRDGLDAALTASQVVLSILLPVVTAPLIYFTSRDQYMTVRGRLNGPDAPMVTIKMTNSWLTLSALVFISLGKV
ncbi:hypothetical protein EYZ11_011061 [Aspergillus tanneri]|nr:hypothetical protein EYZ11_011061 [Aspergillus tanneri]